MNLSTEVANEENWVWLALQYSIRLLDQGNQLAEKDTVCLHLNCNTHAYRPELWLMLF